VTLVSELASQRLCLGEQIRGPAKVGQRKAFQRFLDRNEIESGGFYETPKVFSQNS
jgi:hypothetical protein